MTMRKVSKAEYEAHVKAHPRHAELLYLTATMRTPEACLGIEFLFEQPAQD